MPSQLSQTIKQICEEKGISFDAVVKTIEAALAAAYRKDFGQKNQNIKVEFDPETGGSRIFDIKTVVEDVPEEELALGSETGEIKEVALKKEEGKEKKPKRGRKKKIEEVPEVKKVEPVAEGEILSEEDKKKKFNPKTDLQISEAKKIKKDSKIGDEIKTELEIPASYGRVAAQTAKQVIIQKFRESERQALFDEYKSKENEVVNAVIQRREGRMVLVDIGRLTALMPPEEQIERERYVPGQRIKVFIISVNLTPKGPEVIVSRSHSEVVKKLFTLEIPEIANGAIDIKGIAREAGSRSKVAVISNQEGIDPIGSCVGQRGTRIQTIIGELGGEKIDIIEYNDNPAKYIGNALSPARISSVDINETEKTATVTVKEDQLSLAIGKAGQNVRLAARLTGWKINIIKEKDSGEKEEVDVAEEVSVDNSPAEVAEEKK
jgi:N utilization substance protein A